MKTVQRMLIGSGTLVIAYALSGAIADTDLDAGALVFLVAVLVAHDALLLPLAIGAGVLINRLHPPQLRTPVRVAAVLSLAVTIVALPLALGRGRVPDNPSILPLNYLHGLLIVHAVIWSAAAITVAVRWRRRQRDVSFSRQR
ncbi:hypothetical protein [Actinoplanes sp. NPDC051859]|uniref:hypothetical protein n=1 Tax=Actinoplanes sp. NPDC051859 TaxID=3363909 RepID=UPI0037A3906A